MSESSRAERSSTDSATRPDRTRSIMLLVLGGLGFLIVGVLIGVALSGGFSSGSRNAEGPRASQPSAPPTATAGTPASGGVPVAAMGSQLSTVTTPPPQTLTYVSMEKDAKVTYLVTFAPYGLAPAALGEQRLVVQIVKAERSGEGVDVDLTGMNAVVSLKPSAGSTDPIAGGTYQGVIEVRQDADGRGALFLTEVKPVL